MATAANGRLAQALERGEAQILERWMREQLAVSGGARVLLSDKELHSQSREFLSALRSAVMQAGPGDIGGPAWEPVRALLGTLSQSRAARGFSASETATFVFSLKQPLFEQLRRESDGSPAELLDEIWTASTLLDRLGLFTTELYQKGREKLISRQQEEMLELSTPVVKLWEGVLALPMIGTLDSNRTQVAMQSLLERIVETGADIAILDITGVPTVDTLVAQHLIKTVTAARLMGAECIISGIRPQIAATIVHLGVELRGITTKATMAEAFRTALERLGLEVSPGKPPA